MFILIASSSVVRGTVAGNLPYRCQVTLPQIALGSLSLLLSNACVFREIFGSMRVGFSHLSELANTRFLQEQVLQRRSL